MSVFGPYARYYDLLYKDKDYLGEVNYIKSLIDKFAPLSSSLLDIGCGTGRHAALFAQSGFDVSGLDWSADMILLAKQSSPGIDFHQGDFKSIEFDRQFDVITALFHVVSYLTDDKELRDAFGNVRKHLASDGLFIFDCWHGPAVLHQVPEVRIKRLQNNTLRVVRIAQPDLHEKQNRVDVNYQVFVEENSVWSEFTETHSMRYLFQPELEKILSENGLQLLHSEEWMTSRKPGMDSWSVVYLAGIK